MTIIFIDGKCGGGDADGWCDGWRSLYFKLKNSFPFLAACPPDLSRVECFGNLHQFGADEDESP